VVSGIFSASVRTETASRDLDRTVLRVVVLIDALLLAGHLFWAVAKSSVDARFDIQNEAGYGEWFQAAKWMAIFAMLSVGAVASKRPPLFAWSAIFAYAFVDDRFQIHENLGRSLAERFDIAPMFGLRNCDFGELAVSLAAALVLACPLMCALLRGCGDIRKISADLGILFALLILCGVGFDMAHTIVGTGLKLPGSGFLFTVFEDGGEMLTASLMVGYCHALISRPKSVPGSVTSWVIRAVRAVPPHIVAGTKRIPGTGFSA